MVVVPAGSFSMGSTENEDERPQHQVTIPNPLAVGKFEITRGEFNEFVQDTGHNLLNSCWTLEADWVNDRTKNWREPGFYQTDKHPVVCVSWHDARAYVKWLSEKTEKNYRLLSEAEWEYTARAESTGSFSFSGPVTTRKANYNGRSNSPGSPRGEFRQSTVSVDRFAPNSWGLYQVHGNVAEWVGDCRNDSYTQKDNKLKETGGAWITGDCGLRVIRGGSWYNTPEVLRSAFRNWGYPENPYDGIGFRLARTLTP